MAAVTKDISAENTFTENISPMYNNPSGALNLSISGTWEGTVTLQRSFDEGENWYDVDEFTLNIQTLLADYELGVRYRVGIKTGDYTSGTASVRLSK
jgi:hypothetical protein